MWSHRSASPSTASLRQLVCIGINWCCRCCCSFCVSFGFGLDCVQPVPSHAAVHVRHSWWCLRLRHFVCHSHSAAADSRVPASSLLLPPSPTWQCIHIDVRRPYAYPPLRGRGRRSPLSAYQHQHYQPRPSESWTSASFCTVVRGWWVSNIIIIIILIGYNQRLYNMFLKYSNSIYDIAKEYVYRECIIFYNKYIL